MSADDVHDDLGVYVLGGLEPGEQERFERHLTTCARCRDELVQLRALPPLLDAATRARTSGPSEDASARSLQRLARQRRRERYAHVAAGALATLVALAVAAGIVALPRDGGVVYAGVAGVSAEVRDRPWGMAVELEADGLRAGADYVLYAVAEDGHRSYVASWRSTGEEVTLEGSCYLFANQVSRMELVTDGELVGVLRAA